MTSRAPTRLLLALVASSLGLAPALLLAGPAYACKCVQAPLAEQVASADVVVVGAVDSLENRGRMREVTIAVDQVLRGDASTSRQAQDTAGTLHIRTASSGSSCGLDFLEVGQRYAFLAARSGGGGSLVAGLCGGTTAVRPGLVEELEVVAAEAPPASAAPDVTQDAAPDLDEGQVAEAYGEPGEEPADGQARRTPVLVVLVVLGTLLVAAGAEAWRRRRR